MQNRAEESIATRRNQLNRYNQMSKKKTTRGKGRKKKLDARSLTRSSPSKKPLFSPRQSSATMAFSRSFLSAIEIVALMVSGAAAQGKDFWGNSRERKRERGGKKLSTPQRRQPSFSLHPPPPRFRRKKKKKTHSLFLFLSLSHSSRRHAGGRRQVRVHCHRREDADGTVRQAPGRDDGELERDRVGFFSSFL